MSSCPPAASGMSCGHCQVARWLKMTFQSCRIYDQRERVLSQAVFIEIALRNPITGGMTQFCTDTLHVQTFLHMRIYCM